MKVQEAEKKADLYWYTQLALETPSHVIIKQPLGPTSNSSTNSRKAEMATIILHHETKITWYDYPVHECRVTCTCGKYDDKCFTDDGLKKARDHNERQHGNKATIQDSR